MPGKETIAIDLPDGRQCVAHVRRYKNGRHFRVSLRPGGVAAISMPAAATRRGLAEFVAQIRPWLLGKLTGMNFGEIPIPERVASPMHGLVFTVETFAADAPRASARGGQLALYGPSPLERLLALQTFFKNAAIRYLPGLLSTFPPPGLAASVAIRIGDQRACMGTCRSRKTPNGPSTAVIAINWRAAFLPLPLLRHLWLHEAAHLSHPNHSARFYDCLESLSPNARQREKELNAAWRGLPDWLLYHK